MTMSVTFHRTQARVDKFPIVKNRQGDERYPGHPVHSLISGSRLSSGRPAVDVRLGVCSRLLAKYGEPARYTRHLGG